MSSQSDGAGYPPIPPQPSLSAPYPYGAYTLQVGGPGSSPVPGASVCAGSVQARWRRQRIPLSMNASISPSSTEPVLPVSTSVRRSFTI
jgi:hypothetical protein